MMCMKESIVCVDFILTSRGFCCSVVRSSFVYVRDVAWLAGRACRTYCTVNSTNNCRSNYTFLLTGEKKK